MFINERSLFESAFKEDIMNTNVRAVFKLRFNIILSILSR